MKGKGKRPIYFIDNRYVPCPLIGSFGAFGKTAGYVTGRRGYSAPSLDPHGSLGKTAELGPVKVSTGVLQLEKLSAGDASNRELKYKR